MGWATGNFRQAHDTDRCPDLGPWRIVRARNVVTQSKVPARVTPFLGTVRGKPPRGPYDPVGGLWCYGTGLAKALARGVRIGAKPTPKPKVNTNHNRGESRPNALTAAITESPYADLGGPGEPQILHKTSSGGKRLAGLAMGTKPRNMVAQRGHRKPGAGGQTTYRAQSKAASHGTAHALTAPPRLKATGAQGRTAYSGFGPHNSRTKTDLSSVNQARVPLHAIRTQARSWPEPQRILPARLPRPRAGNPFGNHQDRAGENAYGRPPARKTGHGDRWADSRPSFQPAPAPPADPSPLPGRITLSGTSRNRAFSVPRGIGTGPR